MSEMCYSRQVPGLFVLYHFEVKADNNYLTYVTLTAKLYATSHRRLASLSAYDFKKTYRSGKLKRNTNELTRHPPQ